METKQQTTTEALTALLTDHYQPLGQYVKNGSGFVTTDRPDRMAIMNPFSVFDQESTNHGTPEKEVAVQVEAKEKITHPEPITITQVFGKYPNLFSNKPRGGVLVKRSGRDPRVVIIKFYSILT